MFKQNENFKAFSKHLKCFEMAFQNKSIEMLLFCTKSNKWFSYSPDYKK